MKKLLFAAVMAVVSCIQPVLAQSNASLSTVLTDYYGVKDALVTGDAKTAAEKAAVLSKDLGSVDVKALPEREQKAFTAGNPTLSLHARHISESTDIAHQRGHFGSLSTAMASLAKQGHLSDQPVYEEYCPMKKAYWLSNEAAIRNPYFGSSMLTCGKVTATLKP